MHTIKRREILKLAASLVDLRLGGDDLLVDEKGQSWISMEDYAIALVDELEHCKHVRQRVTVGY